MNARAKGAAGERELAAVLRAAGYGAVRGQQRSGLEQADVVGMDGWHVEVKRVELLNVWRAFAQAVRDAPAGARPLVAARRNRSEWLAVVRLSDLLQLLREVEAARMCQ